MLRSNKPDFKKIWPKRPLVSHKGDYGRVFILAGSSGMIGASVLCSRAALRTGCGLVYLGTALADQTLVNLITPEVITVGGDTISPIVKLAQTADALAVGPGLGERRHLARHLLVKLGKLHFVRPIVLDADGLNAFIGNTALLSKINLNLIITPHPGELAALFRQKVSFIQNNREKAALDTAKLLNCIVVLKGHRTVVAAPDGKLHINKTGNPGMATAGVGDVLTGIIASLSARKISSWEAAVAGVYLHGLAGDLAARRKGEESLIASDLIEVLPDVIRRLA